MRVTRRSGVRREIRRTPDRSLSSGPMPPAQKPSRAARVLAWLVTLPFVVLGVGFILHTSLDPAVFGKWSAIYAVFLAGWWLVVVPLVYVVARWAFRTHVFTLPSGRTLHWRPSAKILLVLLLGWALAA